MAPKKKEKKNKKKGKGITGPHIGTSIIPAVAFAAVPNVVPPTQDQAPGRQLVAASLIRSTLLAASVASPVISGGDWQASVSSHSKTASSRGKAARKSKGAKIQDADRGGKSSLVVVKTKTVTTEEQVNGSIGDTLSEGISSSQTSSKSSISSLSKGGFRNSGKRAVKISPSVDSNDNNNIKSRSVQQEDIRKSSKRSQVLNNTTMNNNEDKDQVSATGKYLRVAQRVDVANDQPSTSHKQQRRSDQVRTRSSEAADRQAAVAEAAAEDSCDTTFDSPESSEDRQEGTDPAQLEEDKTVQCTDVKSSSSQAMERNHASRPHYTSYEYGIPDLGSDLHQTFTAIRTSDGNVRVQCAECTQSSGIISPVDPAHRLQLLIDEPLMTSTAKSQSLPSAAIISGYSASSSRDTTAGMNVVSNGEVFDVFSNAPLTISSVVDDTKLNHTGYQKNSPKLTVKQRQQLASGTLGVMNYDEKDNFTYRLPDRPVKLDGIPESDPHLRAQESETGAVHQKRDNSTNSLTAQSSHRLVYPKAEPVRSSRDDSYLLAVPGTSYSQYHGNKSSGAVVVNKQSSSRLYRSSPCTTATPSSNPSTDWDYFQDSCNTLDSSHVIRLAKSRSGEGAEDDLELMRVSPSDSVRRYGRRAASRSLTQDEGYHSTNQRPLQENDEDENEEENVPAEEAGEGNENPLVQGRLGNQRQRGLADNQSHGDTTEQQRHRMRSVSVGSGGGGRPVVIAGGQRTMGSGPAMRVDPPPHGEAAPRMVSIGTGRSREMMVTVGTRGSEPGVITRGVGVGRDTATIGTQSTLGIGLVDTGTDARHSSRQNNRLVNTESEPTVHNTIRLVDVECGTSGGNIRLVNTAASGRDLKLVSTGVGTNDYRLICVDAAIDAQSFGSLGREPILERERATSSQAGPSSFIDDPDDPLYSVPHKVKKKPAGDDGSASMKHFDLEDDTLRRSGRGRGSKRSRRSSQRSNRSTEEKIEATIISSHSMVQSGSPTPRAHTPNRGNRAESPYSHTTSPRLRSLRQHNEQLTQKQLYLEQQLKEQQRQQQEMMDQLLEKGLLGGEEESRELLQQTQSSTESTDSLFEALTARSIKKQEELHTSLQQRIDLVEQQKQELTELNEQLQAEIYSLRKMASFRDEDDGDGGQMGMLKRQLQDYKDECTTLKGTVHRLTVELSRYQAKFRPLRPQELKDSTGLPTRGPKPAWLVDTKYLAPLFLSYDDRLVEKEDAVNIAKEELSVIKQTIDEVLRENQRLHLRLEQTDVTGPVSMTEWRQLQEQCRLVLEENQLLMEQLDLQQNKARDMTRAHVQEITRLTKQLTAVETDRHTLDSAFQSLQTKLSSLAENSGENMAGTLDQQLKLVSDLKINLETEKTKHTQEMENLLTKVKLLAADKKGLEVQVESIKAENQELQGQVKALNRAQRKAHRKVLLLQTALSEMEVKGKSADKYLKSVVRVAEQTAKERDLLYRTSEDKEMEKELAISRLMEESMSQKRASEKLKLYKLKAAEKLEKAASRMKEQDEDFNKQRHEYNREIRHMRHLLSEREAALEGVHGEKKLLENDLESMWQVATHDNQKMKEALRGGRNRLSPRDLITGSDDEPNLCH